HPRRGGSDFEHDFAEPGANQTNGGWVMAHKIGYVDDAGSEGLAHWQMLLEIKTLAEANGWTTLRYLDPSGDGDKRELILKGEGLSGDQEIYIGLRAYQSESSD